MSNCFWIIKNNELFANLATEDIAYLESQAKMRRLKKGERIYLPDDAADSVLLVVEGRIKICNTTQEGKESILNFVDAGELFGETSILGDSQHADIAETIEKSTIVMIPRAAMVPILRKYPSVVFGVTKLFGLRRQRIERRLRNLLFKSNRQRIIHLLIELTEKYGQQSENGISLKIRLSHQEIASLIGSTRETVTVVLGQLKSEGLIDIARRRILIHDLHTMATEVNERVRMPQSHTAQAPRKVPHMVAPSLKPNG